jgi:hypothetical protein
MAASLSTRPVIGLPRELAQSLLAHLSWFRIPGIDDVRCIFGHRQTVENGFFTVFSVLDKGFSVLINFVEIWHSDIASANRREGKNEPVNTLIASAREHSAIHCKYPY